MNSYKKDYTKLNRLQDKFLLWWKTLDLPFYLTGGTALGRFYLHHRNSEDIDFFVNNDPQYIDYISSLKTTIGNFFNINIPQSLFTEDFTRFFIIDEEVFLKIELVNDVDYRVGIPLRYKYGLIDTPKNILANKLTAILSRDEPKDVFDIIHISLNYSFNWQEIFYHSILKAVINEIDIEKRLYSFPVEWIENVDWPDNQTDLEIFRKNLHQLADDFLLGKDNSLGLKKTSIEKAIPL